MTTVFKMLTRVSVKKGSSSLRGAFQMHRTVRNRGTVLVVDDPPAVLLLIQNILTGYDYRVLLAATSEDAIRLARQRHIPMDLVLTDVDMPGVTTSSLVGDLLALRPTLRVLRMSG